MYRSYTSISKTAKTKNVATVCKTQGLCVSVNVYEDLKGTDAQKWIDAIEKELDNLANKDAWGIAQRPINKNVIDCKWVLAIKRDPDRYNTRLVARGFWQRLGIDYSETFSPIMKRRTENFVSSMCRE